MTEMFRDKVDIDLTVNGEPVEARVPAGQHLIDFLRMELGLTGAHASCEHGVCGACTVRVDGQAVRGCLMLAAQADDILYIQLHHDACARFGARVYVVHAQRNWRRPRCSDFVGRSGQENDARRDRKSAYFGQ